MSVNNDEGAPLLEEQHITDDVLYNSMEHNSIGSVGRISGFDDHSTASKRSLYKSHASMMTLIEKLSHDRRASLFMTVFHMLLTLQGSAIYAQPYAVLAGGIPFVGAAVLLCAMTDVSAHLLLECMYDVSPISGRRKRVFGDLSEMTEECWGRRGRIMYNTINAFYLISNNVVNVVLLGKSFYVVLESSLPNYTLQDMIIVFSCLLLPLLFIKRISVLAYASAFGVFGIVLSTVTAIYVFAMNHSSWSQNINLFLHFDLARFPLSIGILMYTLMINVILPHLEGSMRKPEQTSTALHLSFAISTLMKLAFGVMGVLTFGVDTKQLVSLNIAEVSPLAKYIIASCLIVYALVNFPLMFVMLFEQMDTIFFKLCSREASGCKYHLWSIFIRLDIVVLCVVVSLYIPYFALVSGLVGAVIGTCFIFVFPVTLHLQLKWKRLSRGAKMAEIAFMCVGVGVGCMAIYSSLVALLDANNYL